MRASLRAYRPRRLPKNAAEKHCLGAGRGARALSGDDPLGGLAARVRMYYSVAVALKFTAHIAFAYRLLSAAGILGMAGAWRKRSPLVLI